MYTRCCQVKPKTGFGEYEMYVYDKELKRTQKVMMPYKSCARCREQQNKYQEDNADKQRAYSTLHKSKKLQQEVNKETEHVCSRCLKTKPKSDYGEYKTWAFTQDTSPVQEVFLLYKQCKDCRDKNTLYYTERRVEVIQVQVIQVMTMDVLNTNLIAIMMDVLNTILMVIWLGSSD